MNTLLALLFTVTAVEQGLPPGLLKSLCYVESSHDINAINHDDGVTDSIGICQVKLKTARWLGYKGTAKGLFDPKTNITYAGKYLKYQIKKYGSVQRGVVAYNRGNARNLTNSSYQRKVYKVWQKSKK